MSLEKDTATVHDYLTYDEHSDYKLIDVKGYWTSETKKKMKSVIEKNEQVRIVILESIEEIKNFTLAGVPE